MNSDFDIKLLVGKNIRKYRDLKGLTQEMLAEKVGIATSSLSNIECGKSFPSKKTLNKIIDTIGIKPGMLFEENSDIDINKDFSIRLDLIKNNQEKFKILYDVLKALSS